MRQELWGKAQSYIEASLALEPTHDGHMTLAALMDMEERLPFSLLGLDSDNGGEFLNYHVLHWLQKRPRPVFMTRTKSYFA